MLDKPKHVIAEEVDALARRVEALEAKQRLDLSQLASLVGADERDAAEVVRMAYEGIKSLQKSVDGVMKERHRAAKAEARVSELERERDEFKLSSGTYKTRAENAEKREDVLKEQLATARADASRLSVELDIANRAEALARSQRDEAQAANTNLGLRLAESVAELARRPAACDKCGHALGCLICQAPTPVAGVPVALVREYVEAEKTARLAHDTDDDLLDILRLRDAARAALDPHLTDTPAPEPAKPCRCCSGQAHVADVCSCGCHAPKPASPSGESREPQDGECGAFFASIGFVVENGWFRCGQMSWGGHATSDKLRAFVRRFAPPMPVTWEALSEEQREALSEAFVALRDEGEYASLERVCRAFSLDEAAAREGKCVPKGGGEK